jgi:hypothetical protein
MTTRSETPRAALGRKRRRQRTTQALALLAALHIDSSARAEEPNRAEPRTIPATAEVAAGSSGASGASSVDPLDSASGSLQGYAASLVRERDYYRAISVWKELKYRAAEPLVRHRLSMHIACAYRASQRYTSTLSATIEVLNAEDSDQAMRAQAYLLNGESYLGLKIPFQAAVQLRRAEQLARADSPTANRTQVMLGVADMDAGDYAAAGIRFRAVMARTHTAATNTTARARANANDESEASGAAAQAQLFAMASDFAARADQAPAMPSRSPLFAAILSAVIPGAGQAYTGHWVDAAQAFLFVGAFGFTSYMSYSYEKQGDRPFVFTATSLAITGIFHVSNIIGAERTARFYNQRKRDLYISAVRDRALSTSP